MFWFNAEFTRRKQWFRICNNRFTKFVQFLSHETTLRIRWFVEGVWWRCVLHLIGEIGWIGAFKLLRNDGSWFLLSQNWIVVEFEMTRWKLEDSRVLVEVVWCVFGGWLCAGCRLGGRCDIKLPSPLFRDTEGALSRHNGTERPVSLSPVSVCVCVWGGGVALAATPRLIGWGHTSLWNPLEPGHMSARNTSTQLWVWVCREQSSNQINE